MQLFQRKKIALHLHLQSGIAQRDQLDNKSHFATLVGEKNSNKLAILKRGDVRTRRAREPTFLRWVT